MTPAEMGARDSPFPRITEMKSRTSSVSPPPWPSFDAQQIVSVRERWCITTVTFSVYQSNAMLPS